MRKTTRRLAAVGAMLALAVGASIATTMPADAKIRGKGTFTTSEVRTVNRAMDKQKCLTRNETRKIIKGNGTKIGKSKIRWNARDYIDPQWRDTFTVYFSHGCAWKTVQVDWDD